MEPKQVQSIRDRVDLAVIAMKGHSIFSKSSELDPYHKIVAGLAKGYVICLT